MKKLFTSLFAVSSVTFAVAPAQAQIACPLGEVEFNGSCFPVEQPSGPSGTYQLQGNSTVTHSCSIVEPGNILMNPALNPNTQDEFVLGFATVPFDQTGDTRWELSDLRTITPNGGTGRVTIDVTNTGQSFGIGDTLASAESLTVPQESLSGGQGEFRVAIGAEDGTKLLVPGTYNVSAVLSCYSTGSQLNISS